MKTLAIIALAACLLAACGPTVDMAPAATPTPSSVLAPATCERCAPPAVGSWIRHVMILQSVNLGLTVEDPVRVLAQLESAVKEKGGVVVSSTTWASPGSPASASLSARVPPEALLDLRRVALGLSSQVQNDSLYGQDVTVEYRRLQARHQALQQAETHLVRLLTQTPDPQASEALLLAHQMVRDERVNIEAQLADYDARADLSSFDVMLDGPAPMLFTE